MTAKRRSEGLVGAESLVGEGGSGSSSGSGQSGNPSGSSSENGTKPLGKSALTALQSALAAEQAAAWSYGLVAAYDPDVSDTVTEMVTGHQSTRNVAVDLLTQAGATPHVPAAAYSTPFTVDDAASALKLALVIESDCAAAWRSVIGHTDDSTLRGTALSALTQAALRAVTWRTKAGDSPVTVPFPGAPDKD